MELGMARPLKAKLDACMGGGGGGGANLTTDQIQQLKF